MKKLKFTLAIFIALLLFSTGAIAQVTVNSSTSYGTLQEAVDFASGLSGNVLIEVSQGVYHENVVIRNFNNTGDTLTIVNNSNNNSDVIIENNGTLSTLTIDNSSNISISGIIFKNMISGHVVSLQNTVLNVNVEGCDFIGKNINGADTASSILNSISYQYNDITFEDCTFENGSYGAYFAFPYITGHGLLFRSCIFNNFSNTGIFAKKSEDLIIEYCDFFGKDDNMDKVAINLLKIDNKVKLSSNFIRLTGGVSCKGILTDSVSSLWMVNNMISIAGGSNCSAIEVTNGNPYIYFNNFLFVADNVNSSVIKTGNTDNIEIVDNIFKVNNTKNVFDFINATGSLYHSNYNVYDIVSSVEFANTNGNTSAQLSDWQSYSNQDDKSIVGDPLYFSAEDLHVGNAQLVQGQGIADSVAVFDFDGQVRDNPPDIGADEIHGGIFANIENDTTWAGEVYIYNNVGISEGATLTIMPGTEIFFDQNASISCLGRIIAEGEERNPIIFTNMNDNVTWQGITVSKIGSSDSSIFSFCNFYSTNRSALQLYDGVNVNVEHCNFTNDETEFDGGAIFSDSSFVNINACYFTDNYAIRGGAIFIGKGTCSITNSVFFNNSAEYGGDVYLDKEINVYSFENNTFYGGFADYEGSSIFADTNNTSLYISNSIFWNYQGSIIYLEAENTASVYNCDIQGGVDSISGVSYIDQVYNDNPQFLNESRGDFHLLPSSPCINVGMSATISFDFDGQPRTIGDFPDMGAFEFQGSPLFANAGLNDTICSSEYDLQANNPQYYQGTWYVIQGNADFIDVHASNSHVFNLDTGNNTLVWAVTDGFYTTTDTVSIYNKQPFVFAGNDTLLLGTYPTVTSSFDLSGFNVPQLNQTGDWTLPSGLSTTPYGDHISISGLSRGDFLLTYTIYLTSDVTCFASDDIIISNGFAFEPSSKQKGLSWDNPTSWNHHEVPQRGDVVTVFGTDMHIANIDADCSQLKISTSGSLVLDGTGKAPTSIRTNRIFVEQDAEKFPNIDSAKILITNGTIYIDSASNGIDTGMVVGSYGQVVLEPSAGGVADIYLGKNRQLIVTDPTATAASVKAVHRGVYLHNGGRIFVEQDAEKFVGNTNYGSNIVVTRGGRIFVEQDAEKNPANTSLNVSRGGRIFVEQDAEKFIGSNITVRGGRIFVEQDAEKSTSDSSFYGLNIGNGGSVDLIQDNTSGAISLIDVPSIVCDGGNLNIGTSTKGKAVKNEVRTNRIFVEQDAEKAFATDTALIVNTNGSITITSTNTKRGMISQDANTAVQVFSGGQIILNDSSIYKLNNGASFIDLNTTTALAGQENVPMLANSQNLFSTPFSIMNSAKLNDGNASAWDETDNEFASIDSTDINAGQGVLFDKNYYSGTQYLTGMFNTGDVSVPLTADNKGINLIGNPYPSAIDASLLDFSTGVQPTIYTYDFTKHNYKVYQKDGLNLGNASTVLGVNQAFFVVTTTTANFDFSNDARIHFYSDNSAKVIANSLVFSIVDSVATDNFGLIFKTGASDNYSNTEDAVELPMLEEQSNSFYSVTDDNHHLTIDTRAMPDSATIIPLKYISDNDGDVTITLSENNLTGYSYLYLYDADADTYNDLIANNTYTFTNTPGFEKQFYLTFADTTTTVDIQVVKNDNNVKIYSYGGIIHVISDNQAITNVEIYGINGTRFFNQSVNNNNVSISTNVPHGIYIVRAICENKVFTSKIIL